MNTIISLRTTLNSCKAVIYKMSYSNFKKAKIISKAFSKGVLRDIASNRFSPLLDEILRSSDILDGLKNRSYSTIFEYCYNILVNEYRNEYVYKNAITSKIAIGRHKLSDISYFSEFKVWNVIADSVLVNGTTTAYEIKTEYDSFLRLDAQLDTYQQVFEYVNVVVPESKVDLIKRQLQDNIGILVLTDGYTISVDRSPMSNVEKLSPDIIFSCLRKNEYEFIIIKHFGALPSAKPVYVRRESAKLFNQLDKQTIHNELVFCLKNRRLDEERKNLIRSLPKSLHSLGISLDFSLIEFSALLHNLKSTFSI